MEKHLDMTDVKRVVRSVEISVMAVLKKWDKAREEGLKNNQPLNDNVIDYIRKDLEEVFKFAKN